MGKREHWFKHDVDSAAVPAMQELLSEMGLAGYGFFWRAVEEMYRTNKPEQKKSKLTKLGKPYQMSEQLCARVIEVAISAGLWEEKEGQIYSKRAARELGEIAEKVNDISKKRALAGSAPKKKREQNETKKNKTKQNAIDKRRVDKRRVDIDINPVASAPVFPIGLSSDECKKAWSEWLEHKSSKGQKYKSIKTQEQALRNWQDSTSENFCAAIRWSIGQNYSGIYAPPSNRQKNANGTTAFERNMAERERLLKLEQEGKL